MGTAGGDNGQPDFPIVGLGASAGGLEAIEAFFADLPNDTGFGFVVIQHLSPDFTSYMTDILSRKTQLRVRAAEDQMLVEPDTVYMLQPATNLLISNRRLIVQHVERSRVPAKPIDLFFHSLSQDMGAEAIGVILSGTGSDGSLGVKTIHESGGIVLVSTPESASFGAMPKAAIAASAVDYIGEPAQLARWLVENRQRRSSTGALNMPTLNAVLKAIQAHYGVDFGLYKTGTIGRQIEKQMDTLGLETVDAYLQLLQDEPQEIGRLYNQLLIGVTRFFRDPDAFEIIENSIIPKVVEQTADDAEVRVWIPGCASGEEAYSFAILLDECIRRSMRNLSWKIFATDIDEENLAKAGDGQYSSDAVADISEERLKRYFRMTSDGYQITPAIRRHIVFARHDLLRDPPFTKLNLISCRNLLIYLTNDAQRKVLGLMYFALNSNGYLVLGPAETLARFSSAYSVINERWRIYSKDKDDSRPLDGPALSVPRASSVSVIPTSPTLDRQHRHNVSAGLETLLQRFVPPSFLVNPELDVLHIFGDAVHLLEVRPGSAEMNLRKLLDKRLASAVSVAAHQANLRRESTEIKGCEANIEGQDTHVDITVSALESEPEHGRGLLLVSFSRDGFQPPAHETPTRVLHAANTSDDVRALEQELQLTRESLQATIEELETTNEELQSTNEELMASNEELQSTNEELHSVNEELYSVNAEHQRKIDELTQLTRDEDNLFRSTEVGTIFLDKWLRIRKFTPAAADAFHIIPEDVGRPMFHLNQRIKGESLVDLAKEILNTGARLEREVSNEQGTSFLMRIFPYTDTSGSLDGVVLNFVDITCVTEAERRLKEQNTELERQRDMLSVLHDSINDGYWDWHLADDYEYMSPRFWQMFGYEPSEKKHHPSEWQAIIHPDDLEVALDNFNKHVASRGAHPYDQNARYRHKDGHWVVVKCRGKVMEWTEDGRPLRMLGAHTDITSLKWFQERHQLVAEGTGVGIWDWEDVNDDAEVWSPRFYELLGYTPDEIKASLGSFRSLLHPDDHERTFAQVQAHFERHEPFDIEYRLRTKSGDYRWFRGMGKASRDKDGRPMRMVGSIMDIHDRKLAQADLKRSNDDLRHFAYVVSHDLKTPLRHIQSFIALLEEEIGHTLNSEQKMYTQTIQSSAHRMSAMVDGFLSIARIERRALSLEPTALTAVAQQVADSVQPALRETGGTMTIGDLPTLLSDDVLLTQLLQNLVDNAIKFRHPERPLVLSIGGEREGSNVSLRVTDNGIGIDPHLQTKVFDMFWTGTNQGTGGSGIGLALCRKIAERLGGALSLESSPEGSTFAATLPMDGPSRPADAPTA